MYISKGRCWKESGNELKNVAKLGVGRGKRERPICKTWSYPLQVRVARFTSTQQQFCLGQQSTLNGKVHLPFSNQPSNFLPQPAFPMSPSASLSSFDRQPQNLIPFMRRDHPLSSTHDHTNKHCLLQPTNP